MFARSWTALLGAVAALPDDDFARPSGGAGWLVRDLVCHLVIDAQDVLIPRLAAAYGDPALLKFHLDDLGAAAGRGRRTGRPRRRRRDPGPGADGGRLLSAYVLEWTLHHLDLIAQLPSGPARPDGPPADALAAGTG